MPVRRFESRRASTMKFFEVSIEGRTLRVVSGAVGAPGPAILVDYPNIEAASADLERQVKERLSWGYEEVGVATPGEVSVSSAPRVESALPAQTTRVEPTAPVPATSHAAAPVPAPAPLSSRESPLVSTEPPQVRPVFQEPHASGPKPDLRAREIAPQAERLAEPAPKARNRSLWWVGLAVGVAAISIIALYMRIDKPPQAPLAVMTPQQSLPPPTPRVVELAASPTSSTTGSREERPVVDPRPSSSQAVVAAAPSAAPLPLSIHDMVFFDLNSASLRADADTPIRHVVELLREHSSLHVRVVGHSDSHGDAGLNRHLSEKRAKAVHRRLLQLGVPREQISTVALGADDPLENNGSDQGRARNRRVEFDVVGR